MKILLNTYVILFISVVFCAGVYAQKKTNNGRFEIADVEKVNITSKRLTTNQSGVVFKKEFYKAGAGYISLHLTNFHLATGSYLKITGANTGKTVVYRGQGKAVRNGQKVLNNFWSKIMWADDKVIVEVINEGGNGNSTFGIDQVAYGFGQEKIEKLFQKNKSICGNDDKKWASCYKGTTMYEKSKAVCRLFVDGSFAATGWLIGSEGHIMTNNHVIASQEEAYNTEYEFMGEGETCETDCTGAMACRGIIEATSGIIVKTNPTYDYSLIKLSGTTTENLSETYGYLSLRSTLPEINERIYIPQHPGGFGKQLSVWDDQGNDYSKVGSIARDVEYLADTEGGSSGSPVIAYSDNLVIALHYSGGCTNNGVRNTYIIDDIGTLMPADAVDGVSNTCGTPTLTASDITTSSFTMSWDAIEGASLYNIKYKTLGAIGWTELDPITATSVKITGLITNTTYEVLVQSNCADGLGYARGEMVTTLDGSCQENEVELTLVLDNYPEETSWEIVNADNVAIVASETYEDQPDGSTITKSICLPDGCYKFIIKDAARDGICCLYGMGSYSLKFGDSEFISGGEFDVSETIPFCLGVASCPTVDFDEETVHTYGGDQTKIYNSQDEGNTLYMEGNTWRFVYKTYTVTPTTVVEFDFKSDSEGQIHAIGFDNNSIVNEDGHNAFKIHGTQDWGITNFDNYEGSSWKTYQIPLGSFYRGEFNLIVFINDDDTGNISNTSYFRNVKVYEGFCVGSAPLALKEREIVPKYGTEKEVDLNNGFSVWPVPTGNGVINIWNKAKSARITTAQLMYGNGKEIKTVKLTAGQNTIDVSDLQPGTYLIRVNEDVQRFVVK